ncbi:hypothetical protein [Gilliamella apis]|uniref:hypothetical protein n=1 Tax=Gilliamella apis TaxID=1970738 RepID=UPI000D785DA6|nr:hypothetical protein [Gilliamella apis]PXY93661.1 hypothetical protein DKK77_03320 [Gilliamella apis]
MNYNFKHQTPNTKHQTCPTYTLKSSCYCNQRLVFSSSLFFPRFLRLFLFSPLFSVFAVTLVLFFSSSSYALTSLRASTVKVITGNSPYIILSDGFNPLTDLRQIIGLNFPNGQGGYNWISAWDAGITIKAPPGMHFNQVMSHSVISDGNAHYIPYLYIGDADGDEAGGYVSGYLKATWYENGAQIPYDRLGNELWGCGGPYKLRVEVWDIQANTPYGVPNNRYYGNSWVEYTVIPHNPSICYLRPNDMGDYGGYDGNVFHNFWGFSRWSGFPTTGFQYAAFTLIGAGADQSRYRCYSHNGGGKIWLSTINGYGANCTVNYASEQKWQFIENGTPVITMEYFNGRDWIWMDSFTIPVPSKWPAKGGKIFGFTNFTETSESSDMHYLRTFESFTDRQTFNVLDYCTGRELPPHNGGIYNPKRVRLHEALDDNFRQQYLYKADEIKMKNPNSNYGWVRSVGNFMGEWGKLKGYNIGLWGDRGIWTADRGIDRNDAGNGLVITHTSPVYVYHDGTIYHDNWKNIYHAVEAVCRGD